MNSPFATSANEIGWAMVTIASVELRKKLRERMEHVLVLGFAVGAMEEFRVLPILFETASAGKMLSGTVLIFLNSLTTAFMLITIITGVEQTRLVRNHRVLVLIVTVIVASVIAALLGIASAA